MKSFFNLFKPTNSSHHYNTAKALNDFIGLLNGTKEGHLSEYMYHGNSDLYNNLLLYNKNYYLFRDECALIDQNKTEIANILRDTAIFAEMGPGSNEAIYNKTLPIVKSLNMIESYVAIDISENFLESAIKTIQKENPNLFVRGIETDFNDLNKIALSNKKKCLAFLGSTFGNLSLDEYNKQIESISKFLKKNDFFIASFDTNNSPDSLLAAYNDQFSKSLVKHLFNGLQNILSIQNLDTSIINVEAIWDNKKRMIRYFAFSEETQHCSIHSLLLTIEKNKKYNVVNSQKFIPNKIIVPFRQLGLTPLKKFNYNDIYIYIFQKTND